MAEGHLIQLIQIRSTSNSHIDRCANAGPGWKYGRDASLWQLCLHGTAETQTSESSEKTGSGHEAGSGEVE
jgi:hypothetical protein